MKKLLIFLVSGLIFLVSPTATEIKLEDLYIEAAKSIGTNRTPLMQLEEKRGELNLFTRYSYGKTYTDIKIISFFGRQFRFVALDVESGYKINKNFDVYIEHYSGHALDYMYDGFKYPNMNSVGFRMRLK